MFHAFVSRDAAHSSIVMVEEHRPQQTLRYVLLLNGETAVAFVLED